MRFAAIGRPISPKPMNPTDDIVRTSWNGEPEQPRRKSTGVFSKIGEKWGALRAGTIGLCGALLQFQSIGLSGRFRGTNTRLIQRSGGLGNFRSLTQFHDAR